jgi:regulator of nucleoside diphosphate kinase
MEHNRISVLAPIGTAILGYRLGDVIEWQVPAGLRRLRVEEVLYQPERAGVLDR